MKHFCFSDQTITMQIFSFLKFNIRTSETIFVLRTVVNEFVSLIKFIVMNIRFLVIVVVCVGSTRTASVSQQRESSVSFFVWNCANMKTETTPLWQNWGVHVKTFVLTREPGSSQDVVVTWNIFHQVNNRLYDRFQVRLGGFGLSANFWASTVHSSWWPLLEGQGRQWRQSIQSNWVGMLKGLGWKGKSASWAGRWFGARARAKVAAWRWQARAAQHPLKLQQCHLLGRPMQGHLKWWNCQGRSTSLVGQHIGRARRAATNALEMDALLTWLACVRLAW